MNIETWLTEIGLERYTAAFAENGVEQGLLPELTNEDLKDLGVERLADRKTILKSIARLSEGEPAAEAPAAPILAGERRQVTILFADIAGFTELSSALDAEELHGLVSRFFDAADTAIENYGVSPAIRRRSGLIFPFVMGLLPVLSEILQPQTSTQDRPIPLPRRPHHLPTQITARAV